MNLYRVLVTKQATVYVVAPNSEAAEDVVLDDPEILEDEGAKSSRALLWTAPPPEMLDSLPYGVDDDDPRRDWTLAQWVKECREPPKDASND